MQDKTITNALGQLRLQLIRSGADLIHVDALLAQRGVDPDSLHVPQWIPDDSCRKGEIRLMILGALCMGPKTASQLVQAFRDQRPEMALDVVRVRVWRAVYKMGRSGVAMKYGNPRAHVWKLWGDS